MKFMLRTTSTLFSLLVPFHDNPVRTVWHSCAFFINDNVVTQVDGLSHAVTDADNHWCNGFKESIKVGLGCAQVWI